MATLKNTGADAARVFGPVGAVIRVEAGETVEVPYTPAELQVEIGGSIEVSDKPAKAEKKSEPAKKEGE